MNMNDQELRLECLRLAMQDTGMFTETDFIVSKAQEFHNFVQNRHEQEKAMPHKDQQETQGHEHAHHSLKESRFLVVPLTQELHALLSRTQE
jgi:hypothetical protein